MKRSYWPPFALAIITVGLVAFGTWHCLGWMVQRQMTQGSLWSSETWPRMLHVTDAQGASLQPLERTFQMENSRLQVDLTMKQIALCHLMMSQAPVDRSAAVQLVHQINDLQKQRDLRMLDHLLALRQI